MRPADLPEIEKDRPAGIGGNQGRVLRFEPSRKESANPPVSPKKQEDHGGFVPWFKGQIALTAEEQRKYASPLTEALMHAWPALDEMLAMTNPRHVEPDIWKTTDRDETQAIVNALMRAGASSEHLAATIRGAVSLWYYVQPFIVMAPRLRMTLAFYMMYGFGFGAPMGAAVAGVPPFPVHDPLWNPPTGQQPMGGSNGRYP